MGIDPIISHRPSPELDLSTSSPLLGTGGNRGNGVRIGGQSDSGASVPSCSRTLPLVDRRTYPRFLSPLSVPERGTLIATHEAAGNRWRLAEISVPWSSGAVKTPFAFSSLFVSHRLSGVRCQRSKGRFSAGVSEHLSRKPLVGWPTRAALSACAKIGCKGRSIAFAYGSLVGCVPKFPHLADQ
jgi:hypothetical protein